MEELRSYKQEAEGLSYELDTKEKNLKDANETITILSLRINYMITQKFMNIVEKVMDGV